MNIPRHFWAVLLATTLLLGAPVPAGAAVLFRPSTAILGTASGPLVVTSGDYDNDGMADDLAVASSQAGAVMINLYLGQGNGNFIEPSGSPFPLTFAATGIDVKVNMVSADFDEDGDDDLVVVKEGSSNRIGILENVSGSVHLVSYATGPAITDVDNPTALAAGDFDQDGDPDLAVGDSGDDELLIYKGAGGGAISFTQDAGSPYALAAGADPCAIAVGLFNGGSDLDLGVANNGTDTVTILTGSTGASFLIVSTVPLTNFVDPVDLVAGSFNSADIFVDLVVLGDDTTTAGHDDVALLLNNGSAVFSQTGTFSTGGTGSARLASGRINADGRDDLIVSNATSNTLGVLFATGTQSFTVPMGANGSLIQVAVDPRGVLLTDLDLDGAIDAVVCRFGGDNAALLFGDNSGQLLPAFLFTDSGPQGALATDLSKDGLPDLAVAQFTDDSVGIFRANGSGGFLGRADVEMVCTDPIRLAAANFGEDANADIDLAVACNGSAEVQLLLNSGSATFSFGASLSAGLTIPSDVASGDFNNDGDPDLAIANLGGAGPLSIFLGGAGASFAQAPNSPMATPAGINDIEVAFINSDTNLDIAAALVNGQVRYFSGFGNGTFNSVLVATLGGSVPSVRAADMDCDGDTDLVAIDSSDETIVYFENLGGGAFAPGVDLSLFDTGVAPSWLVLEDFNGDGSPDIAVSQGNGVAVCILLGDGAGNFMDGLDAVCFNSVANVVYMAEGLFSPNDLAVINGSGLNLVTILRNDTSGGLCAPGGGGTGQLQLSTKAVSDASGDGLAQGGEVLTYFVTVRNSSAGPALGVALVDPIPANTTYQTGSMKLNGVALTDAADGDPGTLVGGVNGSVQVMVGSVAAGASATVEFRVTVNQPAPANGTIITNSGTLDGLNTPPVVVNSQITVGSSTVENFTKSAMDANSNGIAQAGEQIVYTLSVRFDTPGTSYTGVVLTDAVPANTTLASGTPVSVSFSPPGFTTASILTSTSGGANGRGTVTVSFANFVAAGLMSTATVTMRVVVDAGLPPSVTAVVNQGVLTGNAGAVAFSEPSDDPATTGLTNDPTILPTQTGVALNANAGADFSVAEGATAMLNGSGSTGPTGFTYSWAQTAGSPTVVLSGANTATPSFVAPLVNANAVLTFTLTVAFGGLTDTDTVNVTITNLGNTAPVADAGPNQIVGNNQVVMLDGSGSFDPDSGPNPLSFSWVQTGGPLVSLAGANGDSPTFVSPIVVDVTFLEFTLTVSDGMASDSDVVVVQVSPVLPACLIGVDQAIFRAGDVLVVRASTGGLGVVDIYIGIILPEFGYFTLSGAANVLSIVPNEIVPIETDWTLSTVVDFPVFTHTVTGLEPFGNYVALMIFTVPGGNPLEPTHRVCVTFDEWQILP